MQRKRESATRRKKSDLVRSGRWGGSPLAKDRFPVSELPPEVLMLSCSIQGRWQPIVRPTTCRASTAMAG